MIATPTITQPLCIIWLHGWGGKSADFDAVRHADEASNELEVLMIDLPGFENVPALSEVDGSRPYADYVATLAHLDAATAETTERAEKRFVLVGYSFGTRVALRLGARYPEKIAGLFLIAPSGVVQKRSLRFQLTARILTALAPLMDRPPEALSGRLAWVVARLVGGRTYSIESPQMWSVMASVMREDLCAIATEVRAPVWLVSGTRDEHIPEALVTTLAEAIGDSEVHWLPHGHRDILTDGAPQVRALFQDFLSKMDEVPI